MSIHLLDRLGRLGTHENPILPYIFCHCQIVHTPSHLGNMTSDVAVEPALLKDDNPGTEKPTSNTEVIGSFSSPGWCVSWNVAGRTGDAPMSHSRVSLFVFGCWIMLNQCWTEADRMMYSEVVFGCIWFEPIRSGSLLSWMSIFRDLICHTSWCLNFQRETYGFGIAHFHHFLDILLVAMGPNSWTHPEIFQDFPMLMGQ
jgi:hypothetical protein